MKIFKCIELDDYIIKSYLFPNIDVLNVVNTLIEKGLDIREIEIFEGVERDMQMFGSTIVSLDELKEKRDYYSDIGTDVGYNIHAYYNHIEIRIYISEEKEKMNVLSYDKEFDSECLFS